MNLEIRINTDNDAFHVDAFSRDFMRKEIMYIMESAVDHYMESLPLTNEDEVSRSGLLDANGNTCGVVRAIGNRSDHGKTFLCTLNV